ncbi:hypothetical protein JYT17_00400 [Nitrospira defluvii]|nr:hypothetical protein [Nitrospira defluvii]
MHKSVEIKSAENEAVSSHETPQTTIIDQRDLAVLWAIGILVSLLLSFAGASWEPAMYEARQSTSLDQTEARVENSQNQLVTDALNDHVIEYADDMAKLVQLKPFYVIAFFDLARLTLFPSGPMLIMGLLVLKSARQYKARRAKKS